MFFSSNCPYCISITSSLTFCMFNNNNYDYIDMNTGSHTKTQAVTLETHWVSEVHANNIKERKEKWRLLEELQ